MKVTRWSHPPRHGLFKPTLNRHSCILLLVFFVTACVILRLELQSVTQRVVLQLATRVHVPLSPNLVKRRARLSTGPRPVQCLPPPPERAPFLDSLRLSKANEENVTQSVMVDTQEMVVAQPFLTMWSVTLPSEQLSLLSLQQTYLHVDLFPRPDFSLRPSFHQFMDLQDEVQHNFWCFASHEPAGWSDFERQRYTLSSDPFWLRLTWDDSLDPDSDSAKQETPAEESETFPTPALLRKVPDMNVWNHADSLDSLDGQQVQVFDGQYEDRKQRLHKHKTALFPSLVQEEESQSTFPAPAAAPAIDTDDSSSWKSVLRPAQSLTLRAGLHSPQAPMIVDREGTLRMGSRAWTVDGGCVWTIYPRVYTLPSSKTLLPPLEKAISFIHAVSHEYYHLLLETLPRLMLVPEELVWSETSSYKLLLPEPLYPISLDFVEMLGLPSSRIVWVHRDYFQPVTQELLVAQPCRCYACNPKVLQKFRSVIFQRSGLNQLVEQDRLKDQQVDAQRFRRAADASAAAAAGFPAIRRVLWLRRTPGSKRALSNDEELLAATQSLLPHAEFLFVQDQEPRMSVARTFHRADLIIGPHGAGLAHILFMKPGARVVEITPETFQVTMYKRLTHIFGGGDYFLFVANNTDELAPFQVPVQQFIHGLSTFVSQPIPAVA